MSSPVQLMILLKKTILLIFLLLVSRAGFPSVQVAFIEAHWPDGRAVELGLNGRFFHVAIGIDGLWYDSFPNELVQGKQFLEFDESFALGEVLESKEIFLSGKDVQPYIGLAFDKTFSWDKEGCTYCSKFVADVLGIEPTRMDFEGKHWERAQVYKRGALGISPDELYDALISRGFHKIYDKYEGSIPYPDVEPAEELMCRKFL